jgi:two-component system, NtrC family, sensor histidine kinase KinB
MRRKILRSFLIMVGLYGLLGAIMMAAVFFASGITPKVMHLNYDSISAAQEMSRALQELRFPEDSREASLAKVAQRFETALTFEEHNMSEPGVAKIAVHLRENWKKASSDLPQISKESFLPTYNQLLTDLNQLVLVNQTSMFRLAEKSTVIRNRVFAGTIVIFLISMLFAIYTGDGLANRLSSPLKEIAEALRNKPVPGEKLRLPTPTSLEMRILTHEMNQLWKRLSELRKLNVEEIASQRTKLETVLEAVEDGIIVIDNTNNVVQCNEGLLKILGLPRELVVGHRWSDLPTSDPDYLRLREQLSPEVPNEQLVDLDVSGSVRTFSIRTRPLISKSGEALATLYLLHDITERKQRERLKTEFISVLSHELKTPLQSLGTAVELLAKRKSTLGEEEQMLIETINEDVARIRAVAQDFVQVGLVDARSLRLKTGRHALSELIQEWVKPFRVVAKDKRVALKYVQDSTEVIWANIDVVKFPWAISNLLSNAIRFSPNDSTVTVSAVDTSGKILIEIADEGPGIPEAVRMKMFDPYYQAPPLESGAPSGFLGLGLTIAKEVVEAHQGKIDYVPGNPKGSIFRISLPSASEAGVLVHEV